MLDLVGAVTSQRFIVVARAAAFPFRMNVYERSNTNGHYATRWVVHTLRIVSNHIPFRFSASSVSAFCVVFSPVTVLLS